MKKIFGIIWMVLVCCLLSSATCWADADVTIQEQVLMNENNMKKVADRFWTIWKYR